MDYSAIRKRTGSILALMAVAVMVATGCGGAARGRPLPPNLSMEGKVAVHGRQVIAALSGAADAVDRFIDNGQLPRNVGVPILQGIHEGAKQAQQLADALIVIDAAKTAAERDGAVQKAAAIVKTLQASIDTMILPVQVQQHRQLIADVLKIVKDALLTVALFLPGGGEAQPQAMTWTQPEILPGGRMPAWA